MKKKRRTQNSTQRVKKKSRVAVMAGSFDPITWGHMYLIQEGATLFDKLIVAIGANPEKHPFLTLSQRTDILKECTSSFKNVSVDYFENQFLVEYARDVGATYILKGIRNTSDYTQEQIMRNINEDIEPSITTLFLMPPRELAELSSSFVQGLVGLKGWKKIVKGFVPAPALKAIIAQQKR